MLTGVWLATYWLFSGVGNDKFNLLIVVVNDCEVFDIETFH